MTETPYPARGFINMILYTVDRAPDLTDESAALLVDGMIDGRFFAATVEEFAEAIEVALRYGRLAPDSVEMSRRYSEGQLFDFLARVARLLDQRRPWPRPAFTKREAAEWNGFGGARPVARVERPLDQIEGKLKTSFDKVSVGHADLPVLILELRSGDVVALLGSVDPRSTTFHLLPRDPGDPTQLIERFRECTGFSAEDIVPIDGGASS